MAEADPEDLHSIWNGLPDGVAHELQTHGLFQFATDNKTLINLVKDEGHLKDQAIQNRADLSAVQVVIDAVKEAAPEHFRVSQAAGVQDMDVDEKGVEFESWAIVKQESLTMRDDRYEHRSASNMSAERYARAVKLLGATRSMDMSYLTNATFSKREVMYRVNNDAFEWGPGSESSQSLQYLAAIGNVLGHEIRCFNGNQHTELQIGNLRQTHSIEQLACRLLLGIDGVTCRPDVRFNVNGQMVKFCSWELKKGSAHMLRKLDEDPFVECAVQLLVMDFMSAEEGGPPGISFLTRLDQAVGFVSFFEAGDPNTRISHVAVLQNIFVAASIRVLTPEANVSEFLEDEDFEEFETLMNRIERRLSVFGQMKDTYPSAQRGKSFFDASLHRYFDYTHPDDDDDIFSVRIDRDMLLFAADEEFGSLAYARAVADAVTPSSLWAKLSLGC